jgi:hypothetical protein
MQVVRFYSSVELKKIDPQYTPVLNAETTVLEVSSPDYAPLVPASVGGNTQATLNIDFTLGSLTSADIKIYGTPDLVTYYPVTVATYTAGVAVLDDLSIHFTATGRKAYEFGVGAWKGIRITALSVGTVTSSRLDVTLSFRTN